VIWSEYKVSGKRWKGRGEDAVMFTDSFEKFRVESWKFIGFVAR
jgi:hypothetical protein